MKNKVRILRKRKASRLGILILLGLGAVTGITYILLSHAAQTIPAVGVYISPDSGSVAQGGALNLKVYASTGSNQVRSITAYVKYDQTKLRLDDANQNSTANYPIKIVCTPLPNDGCKPAGELVITIGGGNAYRTTGNNLLLGDLKFTALTGSGTTNVTLDPSSGFENPDVDQTTLNSQNQLVSGVYTLTAGTSPPPPTPPPTPTPTPTPTPSPTPSKSPTPAPAASTTKKSTTTTPAASTVVATAPKGATDTQPPVVTDLRVEQITDTTAVVRWTTDEATTGAAEYGIGDGYGISVPGPSATNHEVTLQNPPLEKGQTYNLRVLATDAAGNAVRSGSISFDTPGFDVTVQVLDSAGQPIANAKVTIAGQTVTTDKNGYVTLKNLNASTHQIVVNSDGTETKVALAVGGKNDDGTYATTFKVKASRGMNFVILVWVGIGLIGLGGLVFLMMRPDIRRNLLGMLHHEEMVNTEAPKPVAPSSSAGPDVIEALNTSEGMPSVAKPGEVVHPQAKPEASDGTTSSDTPPTDPTPKV